MAAFKNRRTVSQYQEHVERDLNKGSSAYQDSNNKMFSYRRETALQGAL